MVIHSLLFQLLSILCVVFGSLLVERPERFAGHKLGDNVEKENAEEKQIVLASLESSDEDDIVDDDIEVEEALKEKDRYQQII